MTLTSHSCGFDTIPPHGETEHRSEAKIKQALSKLHRPKAPYVPTPCCFRHNRATLRSMNIRTWLAMITDDNLVQIAKKSELPYRTLLHQSRSSISVANVIKISETYSINPVESLSDLNFIDSQWADLKQIQQEKVLAATPTKELAAELTQRLLTAEQLLAG